MSVCVRVCVSGGGGVTAILGGGGGGDFFPRVRGFGVKIRRFIPRLRFFFFFFKWKSARAYQFHFLGQNPSTVAQRAERTVAETAVNLTSKHIDIQPVRFHYSYCNRRTVHSMVQLP